MRDGAITVPAATLYEIVRRQPFGGPVFVQIGEHEQPIGGELARAMRIAIEEPPR